MELYRIKMMREGSDNVMYLTTTDNYATIAALPRYFAGTWRYPKNCIKNNARICNLIIEEFSAEYPAFIYTLERVS